VGSAYGTRVNGSRPVGLAGVGPRSDWLRRRTLLLVVVDAAAAAAATSLAKIWNFGLDSADLQVRSLTIPYLALVGATVPTWLAVLAVTGGYDVGPFGTVTREYGRVVRAGANFLAVVAVTYFVLHLENFARGFLVATVPLAVIFTIGSRAVLRWRDGVLRSRGLIARRAVVVGSRRSVGDIVRHLGEHPASGLVVVGACVPGPVEPMLAAGGSVPVLGGTDAVLGALQRSGADTVIFTGSLALGRVRTLAWKVEGSGVDVFVMPALTHRTAQLDVRPVAGLPLLHVDHVPGAPERPAPSPTPTPRSAPSYPPRPAVPPPPPPATVPAGGHPWPPPQAAR
jgi:FlaA1/EpsC-like NDP-sugar epimerase